MSLFFIIRRIHFGPAEIEPLTAGAAAIRTPGERLQQEVQHPMALRPSDVRRSALVTERLARFGRLLLFVDIRHRYSVYSQKLALSTTSDSTEGQTGWTRHRAFPLS